MRQLSRPAGAEERAGPGPGRPRERRPPARPGFRAHHPGPARPEPPPPRDRAGAVVIGSAPPPPSSPPPIGEPDKCRVPWQNSRIQTYYLANGLPSRGSATPCRFSLPPVPEMVLLSSTPRPPDARSRRGSVKAPDNWRKRGSEPSRTSLFCLEGRIENAPGFASCENSLGGRGRFTVERHYPPGSRPDYPGRKGCFDCCWLALSFFLFLSFFSPHPTSFATLPGPKMNLYSC